MDEQTKKYRKQEFEKVNTIQKIYRPKIKVVNLQNETKWLDITKQELNKIKTILTK